MSAPVAYAAPPEPLRLIGSTAIDKLFQRKPGWFARDRTRKRLYGRGFPRPIENGRWLRSAVVAWIEQAGSIPGNAPPPAKPKPRRRSPPTNGYAEP
jgi:hypothetical protein